jgi:hypothetical protein
MGIHKSSQIHECRNWKRGHAVSFLEIFVSIFWCSATLLEDILITHIMLLVAAETCMHGALFVEKSFLKVPSGQIGSA